MDTTVKDESEVSYETLFWKYVTTVTTIMIIALVDLLDILYGIVTRSVIGDVEIYFC